MSSYLSTLSFTICSLSGHVRTSSITGGRTVRPGRHDGGPWRLLLLATEMKRPATNRAPECGNRGWRVRRRSPARRETTSSSPPTEPQLGFRKGTVARTSVASDSCLAETSGSRPERHSGTMVPVCRAAAEVSRSEGLRRIASRSRVFARRGCSGLGSGRSFLWSGSDVLTAGCGPSCVMDSSIVSTGMVGYHRLCTFTLAPLALAGSGSEPSSAGAVAVSGLTAPGRGAGESRVLAGFGPTGNAGHLRPRGRREGAGRSTSNSCGRDRDTAEYRGGAQRSCSSGVAGWWVRVPPARRATPLVRAVSATGCTTDSAT